MNWIKVKDELPIPFVDLILWDGNTRHRGFYINASHNNPGLNFEIRDGYDKPTSKPITHWMLWPDPPKVQ